MKKYKINIWLKLALVFIGVILIFITSLWIKVQNDVKEIQSHFEQETVQVEKIRDKEVEISKGEPLNVLIIGTDGDNLERTIENGFVSRSDVMMILSLNPEKRTTKILGIPRDTMTTITGYEGIDKINHAFSYGGIALTVETVQDFLQVPIDYYAAIDMGGLAELIDAIGGIEVKSPLTFTYRGTQFVKDETRFVDGVKAMNFARMRYDDPQGEDGRQARQKIVIKAIVDKLISPALVSYYPEILKVIKNNVQTNFDLTTSLTVYPKYLSALKTVSAMKFSSLESMMVDDVFYYYISLESRLKISNELRQHTNMTNALITMFKDSLPGESKSKSQSLTVIINQYPSGLTAQQLEEINQAQYQIQQFRLDERYSPQMDTPITNYTSVQFSAELETDDYIFYESVPEVYEEIYFQPSELEFLEYTGDGAE